MRLSDHSDGIPLEQDGAAGGGRGRLYKTWAMEDVAYDEKRGLLYELGGLLAQVCEDRILDLQIFRALFLCTADMCATIIIEWSVRYHYKS